jgi:peptidoglycan-associated lipoprotein
MKTTLIYTLAFAMAVTLATTGCRHKATPITPMSAGLTPPPPVEPGPGPTMTNNPDTVNSTGIQQPDPAGFYQGMKMDRAALAAYTIHFAYDSSAIRKSEQASLKSVAQALAADSSTKLLVEGNCDERGTEEYNQSLGERRALSSREALAKLGVDPMRVMTRSYGKDKPADPGHDEAAWKQNRRDDFVLLRPQSGSPAPTTMGGS